MLEQYDRVAKSYAMQQRVQRKADTTDDEDDTDNGGNGQRHFVDQLADLLVEAGSSDGEVTREQALRWLLHTRAGSALIARMSQHRKQIDGAHRKRAGNRKGFTMPTRQEVLKGYVRLAGGIVPLCKRIVRDGVTDIGEHELVSLLVTELKRAEPSLSDAQAFSKAFAAATPEGEMLRRAVQVAKAAQLEIMPDSTEADQDDSAKATAQMERLVDEQIRRSPEMTRSQAWNVVVHENPILAAVAIRRPTTNKANSFPYPR
jgi:hypothetical protein